MTSIPDDPDFRILDWDSEKFGFRVARVRGAVAAGMLPAVARRMRDRGVELAYYSIPDTVEPVDDRVASLVGASPVDTRVTFLRRRGPSTARTSDGVQSCALPDGIQIRSYSGRDADSELIELARQAGEYSRFRVDPRIDRRVFHAIYDAWLIRSVRGEIADEVFVARLGSHAVGLLTLSVVAARGTIGLLSVDRSARGRGIGRSLAELAVQWSESRGCPAQVSTQLANRAAGALYDAAGFEVEARERTYHLWLR